MDKYGNTLYMMGVSSKDALIFGDNLKIYHLTINPNIKAKIKNEMLNQVVMGKTINKWFKYYEKDVKSSFSLYGEPLIYKFNPDNVESGNIKALIELLLQEYYKTIYNG